MRNKEFTRDRCVYAVHFWSYHITSLPILVSTSNLEHEQGIDKLAEDGIDARGNTLGWVGI